MNAALIRCSRRIVYPLMVLLIFFGGYLLGRRQSRGEQSDPVARKPSFRPESSTVDAGSARGSSIASSFGAMMDPGDIGTPVAGEENGEDVHQRELTDQELALLDRERMSELAQSLMDSGVPERDMKGMLDSFSVQAMERERRREGLARESGPSVERSNEDLADELRASLRKASVPGTDIEAMVNSLHLQQENRPPRSGPETLPQPVP